MTAAFDAPLRSADANFAQSPTGASGSGGPAAEGNSASQGERVADDRAESMMQARASRSPMVAVLALLTAAYLAFALWPMADRLLNAPSGAVLAFVGTILAAILLFARIGWRRYAGLVLLTVFLVQLNWSGWVDPRPIGDLATLWDDARKLSLSIWNGAIDWSLLRDSNAPSALAFFGSVIFVVSDDLSVMRVLCAALWTVQTWFVWRIARLVSETRPVAGLAAALFGLAPAVMVFGALPSAEAFFGVLALGSVYTLLSYRRRGLVRSAALAGFLGGLAVLARPVGYGHLIGLTVIMLLAIGYLGGGRAKWRMGLAALGFWVGALLAAAPQVAIVTALDGSFPKGAPSIGVGYELYLGLDATSGGAYSEAISPAALADVGYGGLQPAPPREADARAAAAAWRTVLDDPMGVARFLFSEKMTSLWSSHEQLLRWSVNSPTQIAADRQGALLGKVAPAAIDGAILALFIAGFIGALRLVARRGAVRDPSRWILLLVTFLAVAAVITVLEARDRNAFALLPFLAFIAPMATARMPRIVSTPVINVPPEVERAPRRAPDRVTPLPAGLAALRAARAAKEPVGEKHEAMSKHPVERGELEPSPSSGNETPAVAADAPADERLARALAGMSKPKRRSENE